MSPAEDGKTTRIYNDKIDATQDVADLNAFLPITAENVNAAKAAVDGAKHLLDHSQLTPIAEQAAIQAAIAAVNAAIKAYNNQASADEEYATAIARAKTAIAEGKYEAAKGILNALEQTDEVKALLDEIAELEAEKAYNDAVTAAKDALDAETKVEDDLKAAQTLLGKLDDNTLTDEQKAYVKELKTDIELALKLLEEAAKAGADQS